MDVFNRQLLTQYNLPLVKNNSDMRCLLKSPTVRLFVGNIWSIASEQSSTLEVISNAYDHENFWSNCRSIALGNSQALLCLSMPVFIDKFSAFLKAEKMMQSVIQMMQSMQRCTDSYGQSIQYPQHHSQPQPTAHS
jgi:hypothetical protein